MGHNRLWACLAEVSPKAKHTGELRDLGRYLASQGLCMAGFRGVLPQPIVVAIGTFPSTMAPGTAITAVLRAMGRVAFEDFWKPRCSATQDAERAMGITPRMKRRPAPRPTAREPATEARTTAPRPRLGATQEGDRAIWRAANHIFKAGGS